MKPTRPMTDRIRHPAPDPSVLYYTKNREDGRKEIATLQDLTIFEKEDAWRGRFLVPGMAPIVVDQHHNDLLEWQPVFAVTKEDLAGIIETVAQRVVEILATQFSSPADIVTAGMEVAESETVEEAVEKAVETTSPKRKKNSIKS